VARQYVQRAALAPMRPLRHRQNHPFSDDARELAAWLVPGRDPAPATMLMASRRFEDEKSASQDHDRPVIFSSSPGWLAVAVLAP